MATKDELIKRRDFWQKALDAKRTAYITLLEGGVKSYQIDNRSLTRLDLDTLSAEIREDEKCIDELNAQIEGKRPRKAFGVVPRDW